MLEDTMQKTLVGTAKQQKDDLLSYSERLTELPLADLLEEAKRMSGANKEKVMIAVLTRRLECFLLAENLRRFMKMDCVKDVA
jgi:ABC-type sugar transport system ATPase subunit